MAIRTTSKSWNRSWMEGHPVNRRNVETIEYMVTGTGRFPFDMLRRDSAWPADESQSYLLAGDDGDLRSTRTVRLRGLNFPTVGRWRSFGWSVVD
jgi:hypothetical protein